MADIDEEIIIIEDSDALPDQLSSDYETSQKKPSKKNNFLLSFGLLLVLIIIITVLALNTSSKTEVMMDINFLNEKLKQRTTPTIEPSKLENMIAKANYLYTNGSKDKALFMYENIAQYSQAISEYNLGVAQLKNKQYKMAVKTFSKAIKNDEKRCVSAINAAVCSLHLNDKESFHYYIDLAYAYLPHEINSPLYSYYYTLINYYNQDYFNALNSLKNTTSNEYPVVQQNIGATINALFNNDYAAIEIMDKNHDRVENFSLGLLYARVGDLHLALEYLEKAVTYNTQPIKAQLAIGLINLKLGNLKTASKQIQNITDTYPDEVYLHYPINVKLKESLFDAAKAQKLYRDKHSNSKNTTYNKIFSFSPYKVFNANQTISYIRKGNANIYIDNIQNAQEYLKTSSSASNVNLGITRAIKKALALKIREANQDLIALIKLQPKHSILHYNLALTYAQLGNNKKANEHFLRSYHLDAKNYLAGIYAVMTSQLINKDSKKLTSILNDSLSDEIDSEEKSLYTALLNITQNNYISSVDWLDNSYRQKPLYLVISSLISLNLKRYSSAKKSTEQLTLLLPDDILPHLMYIDAHFSNLTPKKYARTVLAYLKKQKFHFNDLYYGPTITRFLYIQQNLIIGKLYYLRKQLKSVLESTSQPTYEIESALALTSLFDQQFEESYSIYNNLIDELKTQDSDTLFLGAVASTAAGHHENAIALLELSKLKNGNFYESRYALALLYMEIKNNEGASIQLAKIKKDGFISDYFDFDINTKELLFNRLREITK
ncbi:tetratricopeptide repeat protein [Sulfurimonas sp.]|jgi:tetratricopeptide (TPR) repeat protein|uniref:tetratricopeptide repeat protein n=1 Tax=Sulfurimonas sp. TaxID=2022749 RepID=UPI0025F71296|nr:tetratricopeptide repeat protein [Sulfurimonas sp.]MBT5934956.1 hypothetical protein [Sulfurimonas sp.]